MCVRMYVCTHVCMHQLKHDQEHSKARCFAIFIRALLFRSELLLTSCYIVFMRIGLNGRKYILQSPTRPNIVKC